MMSAKVSKILDQARSRPADATGVVGDLSRLTEQYLRKRLEALFDGADDLLFDMAERAENNQKQTLFFDTMRAVRIGRSEIVERFGDLIAASFRDSPGKIKPVASPAEDEEPAMTLQDARTLERDIAVANMCAKAEGTCKQELWEIGRRVEVLIQEGHGRMSADALKPQTFSGAFRESVSGLSIAFEVELVIYKLFDRCVMGELRDLYAQVLQVFKQHGIRHQAYQAPRPAPAKPAAAQSPPAGVPGQRAADEELRSAAARNPAGAATSPFGAGSRYAAGAASGLMDSFGAGASLTQSGSFSAVPTPLDDLTLLALQNLGAFGPGEPAASYGNGQLAADLAQAAAGRSVPRWQPQQTAAYLQRASLVGRLFNGILEDPNLPQSVRPQFEQLRFSVIKTAMQESAFIADPNHPVRGLMHELAELANNARVTSLDNLRRIEEMVGQIQKQFDIAAESLMTPGPDVRPASPATAERFVSDLALRAEARRQSLVRRVRKLVGDELQLRTSAREVPADVREMLNSGWGPMMAMNLLRHGAENSRWEQGLKLLDRVVQACDPLHGAELRASPATMQALSGQLHEAFIDVGVKPERASALVEGFERAIERINASTAEPAKGEGAASHTSAPPPERKPDPMVAFTPFTETTPAQRRAALLNIILQGGVWFRIHDPGREGPRWLKAVTYYEDKDRAMFAEFNGKNSYCLSGDRLVRDLVANRSQVLDPPAAVEQALAELKLGFAGEPV